MNNLMRIFLSMALLSVVPLLFSAAAAPPASLDTDPHLVGWWTFDESSGNRAADASGKGHHGTLPAGQTFEGQSAPGRLGKAVQLDGNRDGIRVAGFKGVTGTGPRTVAVWFKTAQASGQLVSWGENEAGKMWIFGHIRGRVGVTPKGGYLYINDQTRDDAWHHLAVVVREASPPNLHDHVVLYKDGVPAEIHDIGLLDLWPIETGDKEDVRMGAQFKGLLDDLRIYDRALSEEEIQRLFKSGGDRPSN